MRPYSPGGRFNALAPEATSQGHSLQIDIVYGVDYQGIVCIGLRELTSVGLHIFARHVQRFLEPVDQLDIRNVADNLVR